MKIRKMVILLAAVVTISFNNFGHTLAYAGEYGPGYVNTQTQDGSLSDYMRGVYTTEHSALDEAVFNAFKAFEDHKNSPSIVSVYSGTRDECIKFRDYFNLNYGYTNDMRLVITKTTPVQAVFVNTLNADARIDAYLAEVKKAQEIAKSLNAGSNDATIANVISWVKTNAKYYYDRGQDTDTYIAHYYGIYSGQEVLCEGYAMAVYQLCAMNGVNASLVDIVSANGIAHAVNQVQYSDRLRWVDTTKLNPVSNEMWEGCSYLN